MSYATGDYDLGVLTWLNRGRNGCSLRPCEACRDEEGVLVEARQLGDDGDVVVGEWLVKTRNQRVGHLLGHLVLWPEQPELLDDVEGGALRDRRLGGAGGLASVVRGRD